MTTDEATTVIEAVKNGKKYFKPLPYFDVEGGTTIVWDPAKGQFHEHYLNRSVYDRGEENEERWITESDFMEMLVQQTYRDARYLLPTVKDEFRLE